MSSFMICKCGRIAEIKCRRCGRYICRKCHHHHGLCLECRRKMIKV
ncbi:MAG: hypothetical protein RMH75_03250 [Archaeoglobaceae archaeon]|nr:hypothetical protein [Archaeoglobaceae archaeon]MDW7989672.1 hypothetical protein [Archaeoglobaceae archaeon]